MSTLRIREGNTGILYINENYNGEYTYIPNYDLDIANELLSEFHSLSDVNNSSIRDNYWYEGTNWYPTVVNTLFNYFFSYGKYKSLIDSIINNKSKVIFINEGNFYHFSSIVQEKVLRRSLKKSIFNSMVWYNNKVIMKRNDSKLLFFKYTQDDFRFAQVKNCFDEMDVQYTEVVNPGKKILFKNIIQKNPIYFIGATTQGNIFKHSYKLDSFDHVKRIVFNSAIKLVELRISASIKEFAKHEKLLANSKIKTLYGIDDTNTIYPLLYACKKNNIKTIAHQHGATYNEKLASYVMKGIDKNEYSWFDNLIFWGDYWKKSALQISDIYLNKKLIVGSSIYHYSYDISKVDIKSSKNILIPYEFLTNTYKVGLYIKQFIDNGYDIFFKPRVDESLKGQLESYCLPDYYLEKVKIINRITPEIMASINIVAGTMSTLIYQLIPYKKIIWVLETEYRYLYHLVEEGLAHKIRLIDINRLDSKYFTQTIVDDSYFFCKEKLSDTLSKHIIRSTT